MKILVTDQPNKKELLSRLWEWRYEPVIPEPEEGIAERLFVRGDLRLLLLGDLPETEKVEIVEKARARPGYVFVVCIVNEPSEAFKCSNWGADECFLRGLDWEEFRLRAAKRLLIQIAILEVWQQSLVASDNLINFFDESSAEKLEPALAEARMSAKKLVERVETLEKFQYFVSRTENNTGLLNGKKFL